MSDAEASPNGNSVSLEQEMLNSVEIQREHNRALAIYKHSLDVLRVTIGRK
jgi:flagellar basal-body rod protein FlgB